SPEYTAYFQGLPPSTRERLLESQRGLYKGISSATIDTIFEMLRTRQVSLEPHQRRGETMLLTATEVTGGRREGDEITLDLHHTEVNEDFSLRTSSLVLATGYRAQVPEFLEPVRERIRWDERGRYDASPSYTVDHDDREIFVQNGEEHTHGFVAPDLGMGAFRNSVIVNSMAGREVYPVEKRIAFQEFGVPDHLRSPA
ncbi:SidA/IucD/PvdA family monooxygenase, partial [Nocardioides sp.]|uniref:SidA/IucD/PvdA family monooxygenase n=1 Tax=Nocardioides sp. TaxID=35761 RepID=UPI0027352A1E